MQLTIISPEKDIYKGEVTSVVVPGIDGSLGILSNHAPLVSALAKGTVVVRAEQNNEEKAFDVNGGIIEVLNNKIVILAD